uniref:Uncharacterized protein n=1 Tax=Romanomermis culicivorax TaxID=13658 RepID=A0A915JBG6_ROMCU
KGFQGQGLAWAKRPLPSNALGYAALDAITHSQASKPQPKKPKVGAALSPTQARETHTAEENRKFLQITTEMPNIFKPKPPPPDCNFLAFNYF